MTQIQNAKMTRSQLCQLAELLVERVLRSDSDQLRIRFGHWILGFEIYL